MLFDLWSLAPKDRYLALSLVCRGPRCRGRHIVACRPWQPPQWPQTDTVSPSMVTQWRAWVHEDSWGKSFKRNRNLTSPLLVYSVRADHCNQWERLKNVTPDESFDCGADCQTIELEINYCPMRSFPGGLAGIRVAGVFNLETHIGKFLFRFLNINKLLHTKRACTVR